MRSGEVLFVCVHVCEHPIVRCVHLEPLPQLVQAPSSPAVGTGLYGRQCGNFQQQLGPSSPQSYFRGAEWLSK